MNLSEANKILNEIRSDKVACQLMRYKCQWEKMSWLGVIMEWGDPREWKSYKEYYHPEAPDATT